MHTGKGDGVTDQNQAGCFARWVNPLKPWRLAWVSIVLMMSGCTMVGPDFVKPEAPLAG